MVTVYDMATAEVLSPDYASEATTVITAAAISEPLAGLQLQCVETERANERQWQLPPDLATVDPGLFIERMR